jgi:hypothetical protein
MHRLPYQVFLTCNSEYHLQSHVCVGVRDRRTGRWFDQHPALRRPLAMTVSISTAGQLALLKTPQVGEALEFDTGGQPLFTSPVLNIEQRKRAASQPAFPEGMRSPAVQYAEDPRALR